MEPKVFHELAKSFVLQRHFSKQRVKLMEAWGRSARNLQPQAEFILTMPNLVNRFLFRPIELPRCIDCIFLKKISAVKG